MYDTNEWDKSIYRILQNLGTSTDLTESLDRFLNSYLIELSLQGAVVCERIDEGYTPYLFKPQSIKENPHINALLKEVSSNIKEIENLFFNQNRPFSKTIEDVHYYVYDLKEFGLFIALKYGKSADAGMLGSLYILHDRLAVSLITMRAYQNADTATDIKLLQQTTQTQISEMIGMLAHQWRQPLTSISSTVADIQLGLLLNTHDLSSPEGEEAFKQSLNAQLNDLSASTEYLSSIIERFSTFFKPDRDKQEIDPNTISDNALDIIESTLNASYITVERQYNALNTISAYPNELTQVILSILKNAHENFVQRKIPQPVITITTTDINNKVQIDIRDNGRGIKSDILEKIFDPYFSTHTEKNGKGLGLYTAKSIIEEHSGGTLNATNTHEGVCFSIIL
jgi:signal transduction histidine kinase